MRLRFSLAAIALFSVLTSGCVTRITTDIAQNPPPAERLSAFSGFELRNVTISGPLVGKGNNDKAVTKIQENISIKTDPMIRAWNEAGANVFPKRTLIIEPEVTELKFINANARVWAGALAGSSAVVMRARIIEKETGRIIAHPTFYARGNAMAGNFSFGTTDNLMLTRVAARLTNYLEANYNAAIGGPSGLDPK